MAEKADYRTTLEENMLREATTLMHVHGLRQKMGLSHGESVAFLQAMILCFAIQERIVGEWVAKTEDAQNRKYVKNEDISQMIDTSVRRKVMETVWAERLRITEQRYNIDRQRVDELANVARNIVTTLYGDEYPPLVNKQLTLQQLHMQGEVIESLVQNYKQSQQ